MFDEIISIISWSNENPTIFTLLGMLVIGGGGWFIREKLRRPRFAIEVLPGPTFCCTFDTGREYNGYRTHQTAFAVYLKVENSGRAPTAISAVELGYHNFSFQWFWLQPTPALSDFRRPIGGSLQFFPFLFQRSITLPAQVKTYLAVGDGTNGVVYFEQPESWGSFRPRNTTGYVRARIRVRDAFGKWHSKRVSIRVITLDEAREYCVDFGRTYENTEKE